MSNLKQRIYEFSKDLQLMNFATITEDGSQLFNKSLSSDFTCLGFLDHINKGYLKEQL
jgi:hypothetical protein